MILSFFKNTNLFTLLTKFLLIILPFYVIIKVYFDKVLGLGFFGFFIKEFIIVLLFLSLIYEYFFNKNNKDIKLKFDLIDYLIFAFIGYGILVSLINGLGFKSIFFGGRYDFLGFVVFLIYKHGKVFLKEKTSNLIKIFLFSSLVSLFLGIVVKFILGEEILSLFGFSIYVANFGFDGGIPIYQGVEASGIRRFQGILDSPLAMGYFLILFTGLFVHINRKNIDFAVVLGIIILFSLIFITYSRAAMLGFLVGIFILFLFFIKKFFKKYRKVFLYTILSFLIFITGFSYIFQDKLINVFLRPGSTTGHFTRMETGIERFSQKPLGAGLATAGPAYRKIINGELTLETDRYYIPESWYIQILIEGGIIYFALFISILGNILFHLYKNKHNYIFAMFVGVLVMNIFLHVFEYTYITILLFLFLGLFYSEKQKTSKKIGFI